MATSATSTHFSQELLHNFHARKLLFQTPPQEHSHSINAALHTNEAVVLLSLICTLISSLGLFCIVKCANREGGSASDAADSGVNSSPKLPNLGVEQEALNTFPVVKYATQSKLPGLDASCVICLSEFAAGECLRILPKCNHGFHTCCIDTWLASHSSCPTCRDCPIETNMINMKSLQLVETVN